MCARNHGFSPRRQFERLMGEIRLFGSYFPLPLVTAALEPKSRPGANRGDTVIRTFGAECQNRRNSIRACAIERPLLSCSCPSTCHCAVIGGTGLRYGYLTYPD